MYFSIKIDALDAVYNANINKGVHSSCHGISLSKLANRNFVNLRKINKKQYKGFVETFPSVKSIGNLGKWKYGNMAATMVQMSKLESKFEESD